MARKKKIAPKPGMAETQMPTAQPNRPADDVVVDGPLDEPAASETTRTGPQLHVKAVPVQCPHCGGVRRTVVRSRRCLHDGAWFQGQFIRGIVRQVAECETCQKRYQITDVLKTRVESLEEETGRTEIG